MALNRKDKIVGAHTATIVGDDDAGFAAAIDFDVDARGAGVEGVFDKLFDHGSRAFDHFARSDAVHRAGGQPPDHR